MSRLIVKNLPKKYSEESFRSLFESHGAVTDAKLVRRSDGKFRRFGFIGYKTALEAASALKALNNSLVSNQKICIEVCNNLKPDENLAEKIRKRENKIKENEEVKEENLNDEDFLKLKKRQNIPDLDNDENTNLNENLLDQLKNVSEFTLSMKGFPAKIKEKEIIDFFYPTKPINIQLKRVKRRVKGPVLVEFNSKKDLDVALKLNGEYLSGRQMKIETAADLAESQSARTIPNKKKRFTALDGNDVENMAESGRLFVRNLPFLSTESDLEKLFSKFGPIAESHMPIDSLTHKNIGIGFITFVMPEHAVKAFQELDGSVYMGRMLHILPAKSKPTSVNNKTNDKDPASQFKKDKLNQQKNSSQLAYNWNALFMGTDAVSSAISEKYKLSKMEFLNADEKNSNAVRLALGETQVVQETRQFLVDNGICLDAFSQPNAPRSKTVILVKNLPPGSTAGELREKFEPHGDLGRVVLAPAGVTAVVEFLEPTYARQAFVKLAYRKFHNKPLYLEWAPVGAFAERQPQKDEENKEEDKDALEQDKVETDESDDDVNDDGALLFVKNLNFATTEQMMTEHFRSCGKLVSCTISKKASGKKEMQSMGYGFVQYKRKASAQKALRDLQKSMLDGHQLDLKLSTRTSKQVAKNPRKKQEIKKQLSSKILVRNVPFQANKGEIMNLFKTFGELKSLRLPTKLTGSTETGRHRGFAFVDFVSKQDAKKAFNALCHSTHLYGRRLVLEWAETEDETVQSLRRKTSEKFNKKSKRSKTLKDFEDSVITDAVKEDE